MKQGWEIKKLSEICISSNGLWKGKTPPFTTIAVLRSTNFTKDCKIKLDDVAYIEVEDKSFEKRRLQKNDIVVERSGGGPNQPVGRVLLFDRNDDNYSFCNFTSSLRVIDYTYISPIYLHKYLTYFYLSGQTIDIQSNTIGLRNLDYTKYLDIDIPIPPLAEQERIVEILDKEFEKIDALRVNAEQNLQYAKDLFQSALKQELQPKEGWKKMQIGAVCELKQGLAINAKTKYMLVKNSKLPLLRIKDLKDGTREIFVNESECPQNCRAYPDDIIYTRTGTLGLVFTGAYGVMHNNCFKIEIDKEQIDKYYLMYYLQQDSFRCNIIKLASRAAQPDITHKLFKEQIIHFPAITEQVAIVHKLSNIRKKCTVLEESYIKTIALCDDIKQALLRKAFNGEL